MLDGVCLQRSNLFEDPNLSGLRDALGPDFVLDLYFEIDWEDLDLSQFAVRERSHADSVLKIIPSLREALIALHRDCHKPDWKLLKGPPQAASQPVSIGGLVGMGFLSLFIPHFIVLGGIFGTAYLGFKAVTAVGPGSEWLERRQEAAHNKRVVAFQERLSDVLTGLTELSSSEPSRPA
jgi:hypothetical protein